MSLPRVIFIDPELMEGFLRAGRVDPSQTCFIGQRTADLERARSLGIQDIRNADEPWPQVAGRVAQVVRKTKETAIEVEVRLDEEAPIGGASVGSVALGAGWSPSSRPVAPVTWKW